MIKEFSILKIKIEDHLNFTINNLTLNHNLSMKKKIHLSGSISNSQKTSHILYCLQAQKVTIKSNVSNFHLIHHFLSHKKISNHFSLKLHKLLQLKNFKSITVMIISSFGDNSHLKIPSQLKKTTKNNKKLYILFYLNKLLPIWMFFKIILSFMFRKILNLS